jgi:hypothetical protein
MPTNSFVRERLIRIVQADAPIVRRNLCRRFNASDRLQADGQIGRLISEGVFITTGTGKRGYPETIQLSPIFPVTRCPFCLREM